MAIRTITVTKKRFILSFVTSWSILKYNKIKVLFMFLILQSDIFITMDFDVDGWLDSI